MVIKKMQVSEHAVSPVVGVMLMVVVTIIIAAVVSSFATALGGDIDTASDARVELVGISSGGYKDESPPRWTYAQIGIVFKNAGGGSLDLRNLKYYMTGIGSGTQGAFTLTYNDPVSLVYVEDSGYQSGAGRWFVTLPKEATGYRMQKFGSGLTLEELTDPIVEPGERFIIYCEYYFRGDFSSNNFPYFGVRVDRGDPDNPTDRWSSGRVNIDGGSKYTLSDVKTGVVYSSGYLEPEHIF
ncbi:type IV pilin N-terminal domain-containing protein [Methanoculleus bourgensis]|uniref:type IV pilin N-terminal domain-containing protein n=1 Tax=Methanoculleus bourgensis TaxID=83986 RepID=UPI0022EFB6E5|nr:type IV pilin N-terminal domain-containing protein [Methanoculleus bourgensis]GLI45785.1 hypothetical protein MBOURGENBZM_05770 [Methanoculleus bourgensis]